MDNVIEPLNIKINTSLFSEAFNKVMRRTPLSFIECGAKSWVIDTDNKNAEDFKDILLKHMTVHNLLCPLATGINYSQNTNQTVPPHVDIDVGKCFNLLIPIQGAAEINIYETNYEELEYRHNKSHWKMLKELEKPHLIEKYILDSPTLLDTSWLHDVKPITSPRAVWCTRWIGLDDDFDFQKFKRLIEEKLSA